MTSTESCLVLQKDKVVLNPRVSPFLRCYLNEDIILQPLSGPSTLEVIFPSLPECVVCAVLVYLSSTDSIIPFIIPDGSPVKKIFAPSFLSGPNRSLLIKAHCARPVIASWAFWQRLWFPKFTRLLLKSIYTFSYVYQVAFQASAKCQFHALSYRQFLPQVPVCGHF